MKNGGEIVDNDGAFAALMTDLSKAFDCLSQELLIANLLIINLWNLYTVISQTVNKK